MTTIVPPDVLHVRPLRQDVRDITAIAEWLFDEWGERTQTPDVAPFRRAMELCTDPTRIPFAVAAYRGRKLVGTASIVEHDMDGRSDLSPWLARVYVEPSARRQEVGRTVCADILGRARSLAIPRLYLFTPDRERFYSHMGWKVAERTTYWDRDVVIMTIEP